MLDKEIESKAWERWLIDYKILVNRGQQPPTFSDYLDKIKTKPKKKYTKMTDIEKKSIEKHSTDIRDREYKTIEL